MKKKAFIVLGLGFGDEGKGLATDYLCNRSINPLVIRFNGGHQAGHTVVTGTGEKHVFSSFGAGTFRSVPTYWSNHCTFSPVAVLHEYEILTIQPVLLVDRLCPVTTHYDILYNRAIEATRGDARHGSCGLGFGATIERHQIESLKLYAQDLQFSDVLASKLKAIREYYRIKINKETNFNFTQFDHDNEDKNFEKYIQQLSILHQHKVIQLVSEREVFSHNNPWQTYIFEGAQGIMLDMDFGFRPYVTRSNTTSKNAHQLLNTHLKDTIETEIFYVTRCYQTRHGAGPFLDCQDIILNGREQETNQCNEHQGPFRISYLNLDMLNYAIKCDSNFSSNLPKNLIVTCLDQIQSSQLPCYSNGAVIKIDYTTLPDILDEKFTNFHFSFSNCSENLR